jgi:hypothetical protein
MQGSRFRVQGSGFRTQGLGSEFLVHVSWVQGSLRQPATCVLRCTSSPTDRGAPLRPPGSL